MDNCKINCCAAAKRAISATHNYRVPLGRALQRVYIKHIEKSEFLWRNELTIDHGSPATDEADLNNNSDSTSNVADQNTNEEIVSLKAMSSKERTHEILNIILTELDDDKAEDVIRIDLNGKSDIADSMVIASGRSQRHVGAMAHKVIKRLKTAGLISAKAEGMTAGDWVLIDAEDVIVHIFRPEVRAFYNLERIWSEAAHAAAKADA